MNRNRVSPSGRTMFNCPKVDRVVSLRQRLSTGNGVIWSHGKYLEHQRYPVQSKHILGQLIEFYTDDEYHEIFCLNSVFRHRSNLITVDEKSHSQRSRLNRSERCHILFTPFILNCLIPPWLRELGVSSPVGVLEALICDRCHGYDVSITTVLTAWGMHFSLMKDIQK